MVESEPKDKVATIERQFKRGSKQFRLKVYIVKCVIKIKLFIVMYCVFLALSICKLRKLVSTRFSLGF